MKIHLPFLSATLALLGLLCVLPAQAKETQADPDHRGELEHYHHEYYSHSYLAPGYRDDQGAVAVYKRPHHKNIRRYGQPDPGVTFAFGGHRRPRH